MCIKVIITNRWLIWVAIESISLASHKLLGVKVLLCCRDGGLKREKVKESYKEEQQKMYSSMIVGSDCHETSAGAT